MYTIRQLADLANVSVRTLHFYDQSGLLAPARREPNGYRRYDEADLLRLQQILFFRELGLSLKDIKQIISDPDFELLRAMGIHRDLLLERKARLDSLIKTVDRTILRMKGEHTMSDRELYEGFSEEKQKEYSQEARTRYGHEIVQESENRWNRLTREEQKTRIAQGDQFTREIVNRMPEGPESPEVQRLIGLMHQSVNFFYDCSYDIFQGLGHMYNEDPRFKSMYETRFHPDLPAFLEEAITYYCVHRPEGAK